MTGTSNSEVISTKQAKIARLASYERSGGSCTTPPGAAVDPPPPTLCSALLPPESQPRRELVLKTLAHHVDQEWLHEAYRRVRKDGAVGVDGVDAEAYEAALEENLSRLLDRFKSGLYRAPAVRRVGAVSTFLRTTDERHGPSGYRRWRIRFCSVRC